MRGQSIELQREVHLLRDIERLKASLQSLTRADYACQRLTRENENILGHRNAQNQKFEKLMDQFTQQQREFQELRYFHAQMCVKYSVKEERYTGLSEFVADVQKRPPTAKQSQNLQAYLRNSGSVETCDSESQTCGELIEPLMESFIQ